MLLATIIAIFTCATSPAFADVKLPNIFGNQMVLQQEKPIRFFGWAQPGEKVTVTIGEESKSATTDEKGNWRVDLSARKADGKAFNVVIQGKNKIELKDVLMGEVWICSGQSNMEWTVGGSMNGQQEIAAAKHPMIRLFNVPNHISSAQPNKNTPGSWAACNPKSIVRFSAVGYYFGRELQKEINVPIGLVGTNWGGTRIEPWTPPVGFESVPELESIVKRLRAADPNTPEGKENFSNYIESVEKWAATSRENLKKGIAPGSPPTQNLLRQIGGATSIYNGMVHGLAPFQVRGAIWYQGESNAGQGEKYYPLKKALVAGWRKVFENDDMPFYWVQLANFMAPSNNPAGGGWGPVREGQRLALSIPNTGMAVTIDIGNARDIHPRNKQDVGKRLALWALAKNYNKEIVPSGPLYKSSKVEGNKMRINFDYVGGGLMVGKKEGLQPTKEVKDGELGRFAIAGEDKTWHWAKAKIDGQSVVVWSDKVAKPVAVRYAYESNPDGANLYNREGLPASPFRTDKW